MRLLTKTIHKAAHLGYWLGHARYKHALSDPRETQKDILSSLLAQAARTEAGRSVLKAGIPTSYREFSESVPISDYSNWSKWVKDQRAVPHKPVIVRDCRTFEPTSGSTDQRKWIPYSKSFLEELDRAASPWLFDLGRRFPQAFAGKHYWSLSWLPDELRSEGCSGNDARIFPFWKQALISQVMAAPCSIAQLATVEDSLLATLAYLCAHGDELSLLSVWSPTFALELLKNLSSSRDEIQSILASGTWKIAKLRAPRSERTATLLKSWNGELFPEFLHELWPKLALISCWDSSPPHSGRISYGHYFLAFLFKAKDFGPRKELSRFRSRKSFRSRSRVTSLNSAAWKLIASCPVGISNKVNESSRSSRPEAAFCAMRSMTKWK